MKRKHQKKEEINDYYKDWFETFLQSTWRMILSPDLRKAYYYEFPLFNTSAGMPYINGFGNIIYPDNPRHLIETKEPVVEVIESDKTVSITSELKGVLKESIELKITQNTVVIKVNNGKEKYYKKIELPCNVDVDFAITVFQNGILDIELKKVN
jgi:HSP20 family molecular chaperone IbpA